MDSEETYVMVSAVAQYAYCPRRCALIHVEQVFAENEFTVRGTALHERADQPVGNQARTVRVERALPIWSDRLRLQGRADVVEFWEDGTVYPVEYKLGAAGKSQHDALQLCAQAVCLEEMLGISIAKGAVYHQKTRRRREVVFSLELREAMEGLVTAIHALLKAERMPLAWNGSRCVRCSLNALCMPEVLVAGRQAYHHRQLYHAEGE